MLRSTPYSVSRLCVVLVLSCSFLLSIACSSSDHTGEIAIPQFLAPAPVFPLEIGPDKRTLYDAEGRKFTIHGEAAWSLAVQLNEEDLEIYLENRRQKGFNAIYISIIEHMFSSQTPAWRNAYGHSPFTTTLSSGHLDFTQPDASYWSHVDTVIDRAAEKGILVIAFPAYVGFQLSDQGWAAALKANGPDRCRTYGEWLGARYGGRVNLMWAIGGDWGPEFGGVSVRAECNALAQGIKSSAPSHWLTAHSSRDRAAIDDYDEPWLDINSVYGGYRPTSGGVTVPLRLAEGHDRTGPRPFFFIEGHYENEHNLSRLGIRSQAYWSVLSGAAGHFYGNNPIWAFEAAPSFADDTGVTWQEGLEFQGVQDMVRLGDLIRSRLTETLVPDYHQEILVGGVGSIQDESFAACAFTPDCRLVVIYTPQQRTLQVDLTHFFEGDSLDASWFNPRTGETSAAQQLLNEEVRSFTPPGSGDWVLLLDRILPSAPATQ